MAVPIEMPATMPGLYVLPVVGFPLDVAAVGCAGGDGGIVASVLSELNEPEDVEIELGWEKLGAEVALALVV